jgi:SAM-dependent methyltransferase
LRFLRHSDRAAIVGEPPPCAEKLSIPSAFDHWWKDQVTRQGVLSSLRALLTEIWRFLRDSTPERRRQRYGDVDYDWDYRVDTTSATVNWRDRLLGVLHSPYQPTDPALFGEMLGNLEINFPEFTFIDLGSGKGRTLMMAADYPFRRILGVELLPALNRVAQDNLRQYRSAAQKCFKLEARRGDACEFEFPAEPTVLYLFNPLPQLGFIQMLRNLEHSLLQKPRSLYLLYHNPLLEGELVNCKFLRKISGTEQYSLYSSNSVRPGVQNALK